MPSGLRGANFRPFIGTVVVALVFLLTFLVSAGCGTDPCHCEGKQRVCETASTYTSVPCFLGCDGGECLTGCICSPDDDLLCDGDEYKPFGGPCVLGCVEETMRSAHCIEGCICRAHWLLGCNPTIHTYEETKCPGLCDDSAPDGPACANEVCSCVGTDKMSCEDLSTGEIGTRDCTGYCDGKFEPNVCLDQCECVPDSDYIACYDPRLESTQEIPCAVCHGTPGVCVQVEAR